MVEAQIPGFQIRELEEQDDPLVVDIFNATIADEEPMTVDSWREHQSYERKDISPLKLLVFAEEKPVAYASVSQMIFDLESRFRIGIRVLPEFRRKGIARTLYARLLGHAMDTGMPELVCRVREDF